MSTRKSRDKHKPTARIADEEIVNDEIILARKITAPITWSKLPKGFVMQDLQPKDYEKALKLVREHFLESDTLCRTCNIVEDQQSVDDLLAHTEFVLKDKCSIMALDEETNEMAGILVLRVVRLSDYGRVYSRVRILYGEEFKKIARVKAYLNRKTDIFTMFDCTKFLRYYLICVDPKYRKKGIGFSLMRAGVHVARSLHVPVMMGFFPSSVLQKKAKKIGMEVIHEVYYVDWLENGEMAFEDPGPGNYTLALMAGRVLQHH